MILLFLNDLVNLKLIDVIDILLVALLLYQFYNLIKGTGAINIFLGIIAFYIVWKVVRALHMELLSEILGGFISVGFIAVIVVFQPEIRRFLFHLGTPNFISNKPRRFLFWKFNLHNPARLDIREIIEACVHMSEVRTGALIILARNNQLKQFIMTGEEIDARVKARLLENIFFKNSPLHDGAVIIFENRIRAAKCILPVSEQQELPAELGLRHRAALGITEQSDAIAIVVSEQSGSISLAMNGILRKDISDIDLAEFLHGEFE
ncbi:MAG TPA: diadenylate cyclase CdaA [Bacteroidales bacterium]|nr:diadenylate cyclase CdaA [Bacteroidales bacterium]HSA43798.1 diadenylate cyclase CdaA [Bacteroidales bacterium]